MSRTVAVRYGYGTFFRVNLFNKAGLPAVPFRTDNLLPTLIIVCLPILGFWSFPGSVATGSWKTPAFWLCARSRLLCDVTSLEETQ